MKLASTHEGGELLPHHTWQVVEFVITLWLYGIPYWLPYGVVVGTAYGIWTAVYIVTDKEHGYLRCPRPRIALVSFESFVLGYLAWPAHLVAHAVYVFRNRDKIRGWVSQAQRDGYIQDNANLALAILMLLGRAVLAIPGAVYNRFKRQPTSTTSTTSPS